jgi:hypothetical protein
LEIERLRRADIGRVSSHKLRGRINPLIIYFPVLIPSVAYISVAEASKMSCHLFRNSHVRETMSEVAAESAESGLKV